MPLSRPLRANFSNLWTPIDRVMSHLLRLKLMRRADEVLKRLSPEDGAKLRELSAGWRELVLTGYALSCGYAPRTADGVGELLTTALEGTAWRAENLRLTRAAEALADTVPEVLPLSDRWDDLCTLALVLGQRR